MKSTTTFGTVATTALGGVTCVLALVGCGSSPAPAAEAPQGTPAADSSGVANGANGAKEGETCGDGVFGRPKIACAAGLTCENPSSTAPTGPAGSSSALPGTCRKSAH